MSFMAPPREVGLGVIGSSGVNVDYESIRGNSWRNGACPGVGMTLDRPSFEWADIRCQRTAHQRHEGPWRAFGAPYN